MATIVLRSTKGSALTFAEGDANFTNLNNDKLEDITNESIGDLIDVTVTTPSDGQVLTYDSVTSKWINDTAAGGGLSNIVEDLTPQLGGDLDLNGNAITTASGLIDIEGATNGNINLTGLGSGSIQIVPGATGSTNLTRMRYNEKVHALGTTDTPTINLANGNVQTVTITSGLTINAFASNAGDSVTLIVSGSGTLTGPAALKLPGGTNTLTTLSVVSIFYDGTNYLASIATDFQ